jgi:hypothetical protein
VVAVDRNLVTMPPAVITVRGTDDSSLRLF